MKTIPFPRTKDERFLLEIARMAFEKSDLLAWIDWREVAARLRLGEKSCHNIVNILAKTYLVRKKEEQVRLTPITFRHYGEQFQEILGIAIPEFDETL